MMESVKVYSCGTYHPYKYRGERNPNAGDALSRAMMDLKDEGNQKHKSAITKFSTLIIQSLIRFKIGEIPFTEFAFEVAVVPSHSEGRVSPALIAVAQGVCSTFSNASYHQSLARHISVASAHKEGGDRSISHHMSTIQVVSDVRQKVILLIDDVTTTRGSMSACYYLLKDAGARTILPLALLETAVYEE